MAGARGEVGRNAAHDGSIFAPRNAAYAGAMSTDPLRDRFERIDQDGNGRINESEFSVLLDALGLGFSDAQVRAAFVSIDVDSSGQIELEEFRAWWTSR